MHMHGAEYQLQPHQRRIAVVGTSGSGKTTMCTALSLTLGLPYAEIDSLRHGPNWKPREEFLGEVRAITESQEWVIEWQYRLARPLITPRAQVFVWLDLPPARRMGQLFRRTVGRWWFKTELWNGNREPGPSVWVVRSDDNILWWGWKSRHDLDNLPDLLEALGVSEDAVVIRLRSRRELREWQERLDR